MRILSKNMVFFVICMLAINVQAKEFDEGLSQKPEGYYVTDEGWGVLFLHSGNAERKVGSKLFSIDTLGVNGHSCSLEGSVTSAGVVNINDDGAEEKNKCIIKFKADERGIDISEDKKSISCRDFCGMRAGFYGYYNHVQRICEPSNISSAVSKYEVSRSADEMNVVRSEIEPILKSCTKTITDENESKLREVMALANYHAGNKSACREALAPYERLIVGNDEDIDNEYQGVPSDTDNLRVRIKRMRDIMDLCRS